VGWQTSADGSGELDWERATMTKVCTQASMSLDGYIAGPAETGFEHLFQWLGNGDVVMPTTHPEMTMRLSPVSADHMRGMLDTIGALVVGRRLFDVTEGWGGSHPLGKPVVVLTHTVPDGWPREDAPFTFVTDGLDSAIAQAAALAGDKAVGVNGGTLARQCLNAGILDEIWVDLVPVLLGGGTAFFDELTSAPVELEGPISAVQGIHVTHLRYRVKYG
jgi:dihydrofolate reductase